MTVRKPNALCIGGAEISDALASLKPEWNFLESVDTIQDFYQGWNDETITQDIEVVFIVDTLFDESDHDTSFQEAIANLAPYCFFGILSYDPDIKSKIKKRAEDSAYQLSVEGDLYYYFINAEDPASSIKSNLDTFYENANDDNIDGTLKILKGIDPESEEESEGYNSWGTLDQDDEIEEEEENSPQDDIFTPAPPVQNRPKKKITSNIQGDLYTPTPRVNEILELRPEDQEHIDGLGDVLCFTSSKGGVGKSTVSLSFSTYIVHKSRELVKKGLREKEVSVAVIDMDVRDGQVGFFIGANSPTINDLHDDGLGQESLDKNIIHAENLGIDVVLASRRPKLSSHVSIEFYRDLIRELRRRYDYVVLDTSVNYLDPLLSEVCYPMSHKIIFAVEPINSSVISMTRWIQEVTHPVERNGMGIPKRRVGIVVNKVLPNVNMPAERIMQAAQGLPILVAISSVPSTVAKATNMQAIETLIESPPINKTMGSLAKAITGDSNFTS